MGCGRPADHHTHARGARAYLTVNTMPRLEEQSWNHDAFEGPAEPADKLRGPAMAKAARVGLEGVISMLPGRQTTAEAEKVISGIVDGVEAPQWKGGPA